MSDALNLVYRKIDEQHGDQSAATRRRFVAGGAAALGSLGLLGLPGIAQAGHEEGHIDLDDVPRQDPQTILNMAATAEVLATIVNTVGFEKLSFPRDGKRKIAASAREELIHYQVLTADAFGGKALTKKIWVPKAVFSSTDAFLKTVEVGDQIFINAYLIATTEFGNRGNGQLARVAAEFMAVEAVHRGFARDLRGELGNDRAFAKFDQEERAPDAPNRGQRGFQRIEGAVEQLQAAGFGFGKEGAKPGRFYEFDEVRRRTPNPDAVNTRAPD